MQRSYSENEKAMFAARAQYNICCAMNADACNMQTAILDAKRKCQKMAYGNSLGTLHDNAKGKMLATYTKIFTEMSSLTAQLSDLMDAAKEDFLICELAALQEKNAQKGRAAV